MDKSASGTPWLVAIRDSRLVSTIQDTAAMIYWWISGRADGDAFLCSYPKSGRTWLRFVLTYYQIRLLDLDYPLTLKNLPALSPNVTLFSDVRLRGLPTGAPLRRVLGSHSELPELFRGLPIIVLRRDIRDTLVSYYHQRIALGEFYGGLESFLRSPWGIRRAIRYYNRWCRALPQFPDGTVLELTYERLHAETHRVVDECLRFLGVEIRDGLLAEAVAFASAENMRELEARWGRVDFSVEQLRLNPDGFRVRKARVGTHREALSDETSHRLGARLRQELVDCGGYDY